MDEAPEDRRATEGVELPPDALAPDVLRRVAEELVTRDGTDYGAVERTFEEKVDALLRRLARGEAALVFDPDTETLSVVPRP